MKKFCGLVAAVFLFPFLAQAAAVDAVLAVPRQRIETADYRVSGRMVRIDAKGAHTNYGITIKAHWFGDVLRVLVEVGSPQEARSHILLEMRPNGQTIAKIAHPGDKATSTLPLGKWSDTPFGPGFSYEDFLEPEVYWPGQAALEPTKYGARQCDVLKSTPGTSDRTHYSEVRTWLDHSIGFPVYVEKTEKGTGAVKQFTYIGLRKEAGVWSASQIEGKVRGQEGSTLLIIERGTAKANLKVDDFSNERMTKF